MKHRYTDGFGEMFSTLFINSRLMKRPKPSRETRLDGKVVIVTGGNRGIGRVVSIDLASRGARVIIACRDIETGEATATEIRSKTSDASVSVMKLDLASFESIRDFAATILRTESKIDILVNNAGYVISKRIETQDGMEIMMQVNCFGPMLLTALLLEKLMASDSGRIVNTSSLAHNQTARFDLDDINWKNKRSFPYFDVYGHSKLGLMLLVRLFGQKLASKNIKVYAVDPGVSATDLGNNMSSFHKFFLQSPLAKIFMRSVQESGESVISAVIDDSGLYEAGKNYYMCDGRFKQMSPFAQNDEAAEKLWTIVKDVTGAPELPN